MKLKLIPVVGVILLSFLITATARAELIPYYSLGDLAETFIDDTSYIMDDFNLKQLEGGSEWFNATNYDPINLTKDGLIGPESLNIEFLSRNTTFGGKWYIPVGDDYTVKIYITYLDANGDEQTAYETLSGRENKQGKILPQILAFRGNEGELITSAVVDMKDGVTMTNLIHNQFYPVPEPATMLLFGTGLIGMAAVGRRKFRKKK